MIAVLPLRMKARKGSTGNDNGMGCDRDGGSRGSERIVVPRIAAWGASTGGAEQFFWREQEEQAHGGAENSLGDFAWGARADWC